LNIGIENNDFEFFGGKGEDKIKQCFHQVLQQNVNPTEPKNKKRKYKPKPNVKKPRGPRKELPPIDPKFKEIVDSLDDDHRIDWPNNNDFSNGIKHLINQYADNVVTNLNTHAKKHITEYLKLKVFELNTDLEENDEDKYLPSDISSVVDLIIKQKVIKVPIRDPNKLERCGVLYDMVQDLNQFPQIDLHDLTTDKTNWFKAMPMFLSMQREIEEYNLEWEHLHRRPNKKKRKRKKKKKKKKGDWKGKRKQMLDNSNFRPFIRNLAVIPISSFRRKHLRIDCSTMYRILTSLKWLPKIPNPNENGRKDMINLPEKQFNQHRDDYWNQLFYITQYATKSRLTFQSIPMESLCLFNIRAKRSERRRLQLTILSSLKSLWMEQ